jgi:hypothetical protein
VVTIEKEEIIWYCKKSWTQVEKGKYSISAYVVRVTFNKDDAWLS